ncbi:signal peptidase I [Candidatus Parcubacteria bacterium]|nr:signal peptidase I [Candidatus Parcubacteria bacterium]
MQEERASSSTPSAPKHWLRETIELVLLALLVVGPIRLFVVNPFIVSGSSMVPTFHNGEYLVVDQLSYRFENPHRGDVIIFRYPKDPSKFFIKRVIGLPGETVLLKQGAVTILREGKDPMPLDESYIRNRSNDSGTYKLGPTEYFVMGDNRISSSDSRVWGNLDHDYIVGRALLRLFPVTEASVFPGDADYAAE